MYDVILADCPWSYRKGVVSPSRDVSNKYHTMNTEDIARINVSSVSSKDSVLFLWATCPALPEAIYVMNSWGFEYKTVAFTWIKKNKKADSLFWGMGSWTRANAELCLLGVKGKPQRASAAIHQVVYEPISIHSKKPAEVTRRIELLCVGENRLELFATVKTPGWTCVGLNLGLDAEEFISKTKAQQL